MKTVLILTLAAAAAASAASWVALSEDFEGAKFPPDGWTVSGDTMEWHWTNPGGYAHGDAWCGAAPDEGWTALSSPPFRVKEGMVLRVEFRYRTA